jgi:hypothetical protein
MQRYNKRYSLAGKWAKLLIFYKKPYRCTLFPRAFSVPEKKLSEFGLTDGTLATVIPVIKLLAATSLPFSFFPLLRCGILFHRALGEGSSPPDVP